MLSKDYVDFAPSYQTLPANAQRVAEVSPDEPIEISIYLKPRVDTSPVDEALPEATVVRHCERNVRLSISMISGYCRISPPRMA